MDDIDSLATKADIRDLKATMLAIEKSLNKGIDQVLEVLGNIDKRLTQKVVSHDRRITKVEALVGIDA
jgi:hypothetical protein